MVSEDSVRFVSCAKFHSICEYTTLAANAPKCYYSLLFIHTYISSCCTRLTRTGTCTCLAGPANWAATRWCWTLVGAKWWTISSAHWLRCSVGESGYVVCHVEFLCCRLDYWDPQNRLTLSDNSTSFCIVLTHITHYIHIPTQREHRVCEVGHESTFDGSLQRGRQHGRCVASRNFAPVNVFVSLRVKTISATIIVGFRIIFSSLFLSFSSNCDTPFLTKYSFYRYMLGVYDLQQRIVTAFPHVLLENCASGGGRFDPGTAAVFIMSSGIDNWFYK